MRKALQALVLLQLLPWTLFPVWARCPSDEHRFQNQHSKDCRARKHRADITDDSQLAQESSKPFVGPNNSVSLAQIGSTAVLHCEIEEIGENMVSWIRRRDYQLLTVGQTTYNSDHRFFISQVKSENDWALHIRFATEKDAGVYECQLSSHPPTSLYAELKLVEAHAEIVGGPDKIVKHGSPLRLTCVMRRSTELPVYVFWYHGSRMINFDLGGGAAVRHGRHNSELVIPKADQRHAGNYSCVPANVRPASVTVHVLQIEKPAAMQHGSKNQGQGPKTDDFLLILSINSCVLISALR